MIHLISIVHLSINKQHTPYYKYVLKIGSTDFERIS